MKLCSSWAARSRHPWQSLGLVEVRVSREVRVDSRLTTNNGPVGMHAKGMLALPSLSVLATASRCISPSPSQAGKETKELPTGAASTKSVTTGQPKQASSPSPAWLRRGRSSQKPGVTPRTAPQGDGRREEARVTPRRRLDRPGEGPQFAYPIVSKERRHC